MPNISPPLYLFQLVLLNRTLYVMNNVCNILIFEETSWITYFDTYIIVVSHRFVVFQNKCIPL